MEAVIRWLISNAFFFLFLQVGHSLVAAELLDWSSPLYTFDGSWTRQSDGYSTYDGSWYLSFRGSSFSVPSQPGVTISVWADGSSYNSHQNGDLSNITLLHGDHQVLFHAKSTGSEPYLFKGIYLEFNKTSPSFTPETLGLHASSVPTDALILEPDSDCVKKSWQWDTNMNEWGNNNNTVVVSGMRTTSGVPAVTVFFWGTGLWLFGPNYISRDYVEISSRVDKGDIVKKQYGATKRDQPVYQALLWQVTGLSEGIHAVDLWFRADVFDTTYFDYFRVAGNLTNCGIFEGSAATRQEHSLWWYGQIIWILTGGIFLAGLTLICCWCLCAEPRTRTRFAARTMAVLAEIERKRLEEEETTRRDTESVHVQPLPTDASIMDSPRSMESPPATVVPFSMSTPRRSPHETLEPIQHTLPFIWTGIGPYYAAPTWRGDLHSYPPPPRQQRKSRPVNTPYVPTSILEYENTSAPGTDIPVTEDEHTRPIVSTNGDEDRYLRPAERQQRTHHEHNHRASHPSSLPQIHISHAPTSQDNALLLVPGQPHPESGPSRQQLQPELQSPPGVTRAPEWNTPPPAYLTELNTPRRPFGLLSQGDLGRLVNRVTALRGHNRAMGQDDVILENRTLEKPSSATLRVTVPDELEEGPSERRGEGEDQRSDVPGEMDEEDPVEILARRIAEEDPDGTAGSPHSPDRKSVV